MFGKGIIRNNLASLLDLIIANLKCLGRMEDILLMFFNCLFKGVWGQPLVCNAKLHDLYFLSLANWQKKSYVDDPD